MTGILSSTGGSITRRTRKTDAVRETHRASAPVVGSKPSSMERRQRRAGVMLLTTAGIPLLPGNTDPGRLEDWKTLGDSNAHDAP